MDIKKIVVVAPDCIAVDFPGVHAGTSHSRLAKFEENIFEKESIGKKFNVSEALTQPEPPKGYYENGIERILFCEVFGTENNGAGDLRVLVKPIGRKGCFLLVGDDIEKFLKAYDAWLDYQDYLMLHPKVIHSVVGEK